MSDTSPRLSLPFLQPAQAQKHVTHNTALERLDFLVQLSAQALEVGTPPTDPDPGEIFGIGAGAGGAWAGHDGEIACWCNGDWLYFIPFEGLRVWDRDAGVLKVWTAGGWTMPATYQNLEGVGVNATSDAVNRLAVAAQASLLSHEGGGHHLKINKAGMTDTAALIFQSDWSGRAEMGLAGSDDFAIRVSADGTAWQDALRVDRGNGAVSLPGALSVEGAIGGAAVTQSATDTTSGRVLTVGAGYLLDIPNSAADLPGGSAINDADEAPGVIHFYPVTGDTENGPGNAGTVLRFQRGATGFADLWLRGDGTSSEPEAGFRYGALGGAISEWAGLFHTANLVGTVSVGGNDDPGGAVIERGSNSNGAYLRLADGTQICWQQYDHSAVAFSASGSMEASGTFTPDNWPAAFDATCAVSVAEGLRGTNTADVWGASAGTTSIAAPCENYRFYRATGSGTPDCRASFVGVGRWF